MTLTRRHLMQFLAVTAGLAAVSHPALAMPHPITLIEAPSNLGLRPLTPGAIPGTWRAPAAYRAAGLHRRLRPADVITLARPPYSTEPQPGTRIRDGNELRRFTLELAGHVDAALSVGRFPLILGGDCSVLLGGLLGARRTGRAGLIHVDAHADFFNPTNYDTSKALGSAAGMDLALATGRGEPVLTHWEGIDGPLAADADTVQIGEKDAGDHAYYAPDFVASGITRIATSSILDHGAPHAAAAALGHFAARKLDRVWLHVDVDILDQTVMPAVDSPGPNGLSFAQLAGLVSALVASGKIVGADVAIFDPDLDPDGRHAAALTACLSAAFAPLAGIFDPRGHEATP